MKLSVTVFESSFGLKTGIDFAHFGLELGMVFEETKGSVWTYLSFQFQMKNEQKINKWIRNGFYEILFELWSKFYLYQV